MENMQFVRGLVLIANVTQVDAFVGGMQPVSKPAAGGQAVRVLR